MAKASKKSAPSIAAEAAAAAETPTTSAPKETKSRGPKGVAADSTISVVATSNPKRTGSKAHAMYELYKDGMTVQEALDAGISTPDLIYNASHSFITISGYSPVLVQKKEPKAPKAPKAPKEPKAPKAPKAAKAEDGEELE